MLVFFFQAEDGIRDLYVTGVQTCALPIYSPGKSRRASASLTMTTFGAPPRSAAVNSRPAKSGMPNVEKNPGTTSRCCASRDGGDDAPPAVGVASPSRSIVLLLEPPLNGGCEPSVIATTPGMAGMRANIPS